MMKKLLTLLLTCTPLLALEVSTGYRKDTINWNFKDPSINLFDKTLTSQRTYEFQWVDLKQVTLGSSIDYTTSYDVLLKFAFDVSFVVQGHFREKGLFAGYFGSPYVEAHGGTALISLALGYPLYFCDDDFRFTPLLGGLGNAFHLTGQKFVQGHGRFIGPTVGFEWAYCLTQANRFVGSFNYCFGKFCGQSEKHADEDFAIFRGKAFGRGLFCTIGLDKSFWDVWKGGFKFTWKDWLTFRRGELHARVKRLESNFCKDTPMGALTWESFSVEATLSRSF